MDFKIKIIKIVLSQFNIISIYCGHFYHNNLKTKDRDCASVLVFFFLHDSPVFSQTFISEEQ